MPKAEGQPSVTSRDNLAGLAEGAYARKQIFSRCRLVAWSHGSRFSLAARLVGASAGGRLLDYGCGDGTFLALVHEQFARAIGTDADVGQLADCARRFQGLPNVTFLPPASLADPSHAGAYDVITCMEVLEHCLEAPRGQVLADLHRLIKPGGRVIISVPIETGASLVVKQVARRIAGWRGVPDYRYSERYTWLELARMTIGPRHRRIARPVYGGTARGSAHEYHGHKGFDWCALEAEARTLFLIDERRYSPLAIFGPFLNSQAWLICRPR